VSQRACGSARRSVSGAGLGFAAEGSGRGFQGDFVAEGFELADVVALATFGVDPGVEEVTAQVGEAGGGIGASRCQMITRAEFLLTSCQCTSLTL
jgi:hypothetical protein